MKNMIALVLMLAVLSTAIGFAQAIKGSGRVPTPTPCSNASCATPTPDKTPIPPITPTPDKTPIPPVTPTPCPSIKCG